jgi:hypothetical protein
MATTTMAMIQGVHRNHLMRFPFLTYLLLKGDSMSWPPPKGHSHPQKALPKTSALRNRRPNIKKLPLIIPRAVAPTMTYGEK